MKKLFLTLLILVLALGCTALAENAPANVSSAGGFQYTEKNGRLTIVGYPADEVPGPVVIPMTLAGKPVAAFSLDALPAGTETVYCPASAVWEEPTGERSIAIFQYDSYENWLKNPRLQRQLPQMAENDLALVSAARYFWTKRSFYTDSMVLRAQELPASLAGQPLLCALPGEQVIYTSDDWEYMLENQKARLLKSPAAQGTLVVPTHVDGYPVAALQAEALAPEVDTVYLPNDAALRTDGRFSETRTVTVLRYYDYARLESAPWLKDRVPGITKDQLALTDVSLCTLTPEKAEHTPCKVYIHQLLPALEGKPLLLATYYDVVIRTCGPWEYYLSLPENRLYLAGTTAPEQTLFVPQSLDGYPLYSVNLSLFPAEVDTLWLYEGVSVSCAGTERDIRVISYADFGKVQQKEEYLRRVPDMEEGQLAFTSVRDYHFREDGSASSRYGAIESAMLPAMLDGKALRIAASQDSVLYQDGAWQYLLDSVKGEVRLTGITQETEETHVFLPASIAGYPVTQVSTAAIPAHVTRAYLPLGTALYGADALTQSLELVYYADKTTAQKNPLFTEQLSALDDDTLALCDIRLSATDESGMRTTRSHTLFADTLPQTLNGQKTALLMAADQLLYASGPYRYTRSESGAGVYIHSLATPPETDVLVLPTLVDGLPVLGWNMQIARDYSLSALAVPAQSYAYNQQAVSFDEYLYVDKAYALSLVENHNDRLQYSHLGENELAVKAFTHYTNGEKDSTVTLDYYKIPTQLNGKTVVNHIAISKGITQYQTEEYDYILLSANTAAITKCHITNAKTLEIPAQLEGKTVVAIMGDDYGYAINSSRLTTLKLPETLTTLGKKAVSAWYLTRLVLPKGLVEIGDQAIDCYKLSNLTIPDTLTSLGREWGDTSIRTFTFPKSLTSIGALAFTKMDSITSLKVPDTVETIGPGAFSDMRRLTALVLNNTVTALPERLAAGNPKLAKITIPAPVTTIGKEAFADCPKLATVTFSRKDGQLTEIGEGAFRNVVIMPKVTLPEGLTTIRRDAFSGCIRLATVVMPSTLQVIEPYAFSGCNALTKITLPDGITTVSEGLFQGCKRLASVTLPASITEIEDLAFDGCAKNLVFQVMDGSFAHTWAVENGYKVKVTKGR